MRGWRGCPTCRGAGTLRFRLMPWPATCSFNPPMGIPPSRETHERASRPFISCYKPARGEFNFVEANAIWHAFDVVREIYDFEPPLVAAGHFTALAERGVLPQLDWDFDNSDNRPKPKGVSQ